MIAITSVGHNGQAHIDHDPDECPTCHRSVVISGLYFVKISELWIQGVYQCASLACHKLFLASFEKNTGTGYFYFRYSGPYVAVPKAMDPKLNEISSEFAETYQQAWKAKELNLKKIAGTGFRRSLEFLVKDYAIRGLADDKKAHVLRMPMAQCIRNHIHEDGIRTVAERAAWLGNDETHYLRIWEDKDINDLIDLIDSVADWIIIHLKTEQLKQSMASPNRRDIA